MLRCSVVNEEIREAMEHIIGVEPSLYEDGEALSTEFVDDRQHLDGTTIVGAVLYEVIGPDMVAMRWPEPDTRPIVEPEPPTLGLFLSNLQPPIFLSTSVIGLLSHSEPAADLFHGTTLRQKDLRVPKLPDDLLNAVSLALHPDLPSRSRYCHTLTQNLDHLLGGTSGHRTEMNMAERYGTVSDEDLIRAIDAMTFDDRKTEILLAATTRIYENHEQNTNNGTRSRKTDQVGAFSST
jgi:hypothetical protein